MYSELPRLLPTRSEKEGFTVLVVEGRRVLVNGRVNRNLLRPLLRFCGSFTAPSRPFTALFLSRPLRIFNGPFWAKGPWPQPLATLASCEVHSCSSRSPPYMKGGGGGGGVVDWPVAGKRRAYSECGVTSEENWSAATKRTRVRAQLSFIDCRRLYLYYWPDWAGCGGSVGESHHSPPPPSSKRQKGAVDVMPTALKWRGQLGAVVAQPLRNALLHNGFFV